MKREASLLLILFLAAIISSGHVSASFSVGNASHFIDKLYAPNKTISGWINISLNGEPTVSVFNSTRGSISLIRLLNLNNLARGSDYSCIPSDCASDYAPIGGSNGAAKEFALDSGSEKIVGIKFNGDETNVNSLNLNIGSDAISSCTTQVEVDFMNDGTIDFINNKSSNSLCGTKSGGCFSNPNVNFTLGPSPAGNPLYCERINLIQAPALIAGAWIKNETPGGQQAGTVGMQLFGKDGAILGGCNLPSIDSSGKEYNCTIGSSIPEQDDYYVCLSTNGGKYQIQGDSGNKCGFPSAPGGNPETGSYNIFAQTKQFYNFGTKTIGSANLTNFINEYFMSKYGTNSGIKCPSDGCILPVRIKSNVNQSISMDSLTSNYDYSQGSVSTNEFWNLTQIPARVLSGFLKINLSEGNFLTSSNFGTQNFSLKLDSTLVFSDNISIQKIPQIINVAPHTAPAGYPVKLNAKIETFNSGKNITKYAWNFGDGTPGENTTTDKVTHRYNSIGSYTLTLTITNSDSYTSTKSFNISVQTPVNTVNAILSKYLNNSANLKSQIGNLPTFQKNSIEKIMNLSELDSILGDLQQRTATAASDEDYIGIMTDLSNLNVPDSISATKTAPNFFYIPDDQNIDLNILKQISVDNSTTSNPQDYIDAIDTWYLENVQTTLDFKEISANYDGNPQAIGKFFDFTIKKGGAKTTYIFIMPKLENLEFKENYNQKEIGDYVYIDLPRDSNEISFSTTQDADFTSLPAFIAPRISELSVTEGPIEQANTSDITFFGLTLPRWVWITISLFVIALSGFFIYALLRYWYRIKYENYLFSNRNDLYNVVSYIQNMKRQGVEDRRIIAGLRKAGWNSEQVSYIMKKYHGRRTGLI